MVATQGINLAIGRSDRGPRLRSMVRISQLRFASAKARVAVSLECRKIYVALSDTKAERTGYLRIIDVACEDYLHPVQRFVAAELPVSTRRAVLQVA